MNFCEHFAVSVIAVIFPFLITIILSYQDYMPDFSTFIHTNTESTALLYELIVSDRRRYPVKKMVFASSQAVCGEGWYLCPACAHRMGIPLEKISSEASGRVHQYHLPPAAGLIVTPPARSVDQLTLGDWEPKCQKCGEELAPVLIGEEAASPGTTYGISKYAIELLADRLGRRYGIPAACMRYTYVQGPRNSFYNAYSGIARRFALRLLNGLPPVVYEDGKQLRDYINVRDVVRANVLVMEDDRANFGVFNVGGGRAITVLEFACLMLAGFQSHLDPEVTGEYRLGDTRHTISDNSRLNALGWEPTISVERNVAEYVEWMSAQQMTCEYLEEAERTMRDLGVVRKSGM
jgi:dTDP-L-rhamnose 4-epimerase